MASTSLPFFFRVRVRRIMAPPPPNQQFSFSCFLLPFEKEISRESLGMECNAAAAAGPFYFIIGRLYFFLTSRDPHHPIPTEKTRKWPDSSRPIIAQSGKERKEKKKKNRPWTVVWYTKPDVLLANESLFVFD